MKSNLNNNTILNSDWLYNLKFKITFDIIKVQNLNNVKGFICFCEHNLLIKIIEDKKKANITDIIKNLFHPIFHDEENYFHINYCLIEKINSQNGILEISLKNPVSRKIFYINISSIEKINLLYSTYLKVEEINKIAKFISNKIISEIKNKIEDFLLMINSFKETIDQSIDKNLLIEERTYKSFIEAKKFYEKNIKELKKQNQIKNDINKKILKAKINAKQIDRVSISLLSQIESSNYASFELILLDLKNRGLKLIEEKITLFFEITNLEKNILNLKKLDKFKVAVNLKNININFPENKDVESTFKNTKISLYKNKFFRETYKQNQNEIHNLSTLTPKDCFYRKNTIDFCNNNNNKSYDDSKKVGNYKNDISITDKGRNDIRNIISTQNKNSYHEKNPRSFSDIKHPNNNNEKSDNLEVNVKIYKNRDFTNISEKFQSFNTEKYNSTNINIIGSKSDTITDVNALYEDIVNQKMNSNNNNNNQINNESLNEYSKMNTNIIGLYDKNYINTGTNINILLSNNQFEENFFLESEEDLYYNRNLKSNFYEENENVSSSTKTNSQKEEMQNSNINEGIKYITNLKELKEKNDLNNPIETPKFCNKENTKRIKKTPFHEIEKAKYVYLSQKINFIKENHLFLVNNSWNNIFLNTSEIFCRKYFEICFEDFFPKFFNIEKDLNGVFKIDGFFSYLFYLRGLKNLLFTDENKIQFSNVFFLD